jgi:hypothetical protein
MGTVVLAILIVGTAVMAACESERIPAAVEWRGHTYQEVRALADLPAVIRSGLGVDRPGRDGVADRGRPFNVTDTVDDNLPMRRFLAAGREGSTWLVALERGGRGYSVEVFLFSTLEATPNQRWLVLREVIQQMPQQHEG